MAGLGESVKHVWSGDVDLVDGKLQELYDEYLKRRSFVEGLGLGGRQGQWDVSNDLVAIESQLTSDMDFIVSCRAVNFPKSKGNDNKTCLTV